MNTDKTIAQQFREEQSALRVIYVTGEAKNLQRHPDVTNSEAGEIFNEAAKNDAKKYQQHKTFHFSKEEGAAAFMRVLLRDGKNVLGQPSGGGMFSPPEPPATIAIPEQIFVYQDLDGNSTFTTSVRDHYGNRTTVELTERVLLDSTKVPMPHLVEYAVSQGVEVSAHYSEADRVHIVERLCNTFKIVNCITSDLQVPWGAVEVTDIGLATLMTDLVPEFGQCFHINMIAPNAKKAEVEEFFYKIEDELKYRSLHTGRALESAQEGAGFMNPFVTVREDIIYPTWFEPIIERNILGGIKNFDKNVAKRKEGRVKKKVLLAAEFGRGKTMSLNYFMQVALQARLTVIRMSTAAGDTLEKVLNKAKKYPRGAVIVIEDIDTIINQYNDFEKKKMQDLLDGQLTKGQRITIYATTNHEDKISQPFVRRFTDLVRLPALDRDGVERIFKRNIDNIDPLMTTENWDAIYEMSRDLTQSFLMTAIELAGDLADQDEKEFVTFDDLTTAIKSKDDHYNLYLKAPVEGEEKTPAQIADEYQRDMVKQTIEVVLKDHYLESENSGEVMGIHSR